MVSIDAHFFGPHNVLLDVVEEEDLGGFNASFANRLLIYSRIGFVNLNKARDDRFIKAMNDSSSSDSIKIIVNLLDKLAK